MGDRCYLEITLARQDLDRFGDVLGYGPGARWWDEELEEPAPGIVSVALYEANYALYDARQEAARRGIPFCGRHGAGGDYGPYAFVALGGQLYEVATEFETGEPVVDVGDDLELKGLDAARAYLAKRRELEALFGISGSSSNPEPAAEAEDGSPAKVQS